MSDLFYWWALVIGGIGVGIGLVGLALSIWFLRKNREETLVVGALETVDLVRNGDMEQPYIQHDGTTIVADRWMPFFSGHGSELTSQICQKPEFKPIPKSLADYRVVSGQHSQCWFIRWKVMDGGVYQQVEVPVGAMLTFSAQVQTWCSQSDSPLSDDGELYFKLGIDRSGGMNAYDPEVVWQEWVRGTKAFQRIEMQFVTIAPRITLFVRAANKWPMSHNDAYLDDVRLELESGGSPAGEVTWAELANRYREFAELLES